MKKIILLSAVMFSFHYAFVQPRLRTQLTGKVTDVKTGEPLPGASVVLADSRIGATSNREGVFVLNNVPTGHTIIEVSYSGYETIVDHIDIAAQNQVDFKLNPSVREYEGVTVTGVAGATSIRKAPVPITRINKAELLATPSTNIIDAISRQPGVTQLSTGPAISKPVIRGLGYNRLVTINDGVRQEGQQWGDEHGIEIDENSVSRVEILKGPASLIYGSDAIAGVVNIITTSPAENNTVTGNILSSYQTNNRQRSLFSNFAGNKNGFNWNAWGDYTAAADYSNKYDGRVFNSKFNTRNAGGYIGYNGAWGFTHLIASKFNQKVGIVEGARDENGNFTRALPDGNEAVATSDDFNSITPDIPFQHIRHTKIITDNQFNVGSGKIKVNLAMQRNQRIEHGNADNPDENSLYFHLHTFNYQASYQFDDKNGWITSVGMNGMSQQNKNKGLEALIPEYNMVDAGAYLYSQKTIHQATISGGVRYDNRTLHSKSFIENNIEKFPDFHKEYSNVSASLGVSYIPVKQVVLKLNLARGFRAPAVPELASNGAHEGTNRYEYGNRDLKSETTLQADFDIELSTEHVLFSVSAFYNHINNFIFYSKLNNAAGTDSLVDVEGTLTPAYQFNQHTTNLPGFEALIDIHPHPLDWLHWENSISYVRGSFTEPVGVSKNVPFVPATRWSSEIKAALFAKSKIFQQTTFTVEAVNYFKQNRPFTSFGTETATNGYTLVNAGINTTIYMKKRKALSLYLLGNNLGDVAYQNHLSRLKYVDINEATGRRGVFNVGRNIVFKVNVPIGK